MLGFVQSWFAPACNPIGVDFGSDCLRLAQVDCAEGEYRLAAAATADVPTTVRNDLAGRFNFFTENVRELVASGRFRGRRAVLNLPAAFMHIQHLRLPKMEDDALKKAILWEARGKLPFDPSQAVLRHVVAGEIYHDQEPKYEVIVIAARRDLMDKLLECAAKAKLDVAGVNVEPKALVDCFTRVYRRKSDEVATCFVDIGCTSSRAVIAREGRIRFARVLPVGGDHFNRAVAGALQLPLDEARLLRVRLAAAGTDEPLTTAPAPEARKAPEPTKTESDETGFALLSAALSAAQQREAPGPSTAAPEERCEAAAGWAAALHPASPERDRVDAACREPLNKLVEELALCRRYYEATFPQQPLERLVFVGGEAHQRGLCQQIAREMGVAAQIGDPMARLGKHLEPGLEALIDRRNPQPGWALAMGLSMGPVAAEPAAAAAATK